MNDQIVRRYSTLAIANEDQLLYGTCPHPLECGLGLTIGGGTVFPEVNFTLPPMNITDETWTEVVAHYDQMAEQILRRAASLSTPGIVLEFELLPPMTERPEWGAELTALLKRHLKAYYEKKKSRGTGKAIIALARKFLGIIYRTLKNKWLFEDFPNFVLAEEATA